MSSFGIVALIRRLSGVRRTGHAGTLDPQATGVLPVCLGQATRVVEFLSEAAKTYLAEIELGITTDTYDAWGTITAKQDPSGVSRRQLESALAAFQGTIEQTPPMYSAVKYQGRPLYKLARAGISVARKSRPAEIYRIELLNWQPPVATVEVECGKGTYIRAIAHDLGQVLGCGAILKSLARTKYGLFDIKDAVRLDQLEDAFHHGYGHRFLYPLDAVLSHYRAVIVSDDTAQAIRNGVAVELAPAGINEDRLRVYTNDGCFLSILRFSPEKGKWQPQKVFSHAGSPEYQA